MARLAVDTRERALMKHLDAKRVPYRAVNLPVGDVLCTYEGCGSSWIMERKRADDFAASIQDGRWHEQSSRLFSSSYRVFFVIEGDLRWLDRMYEPMIGAIVNSSLRSSCCFRTWDCEETACFVLHLMKKLQKCPPPAGVSTGGLRPPQSKRQRASEADSVFARQLMCIPSVSERIAMSLVQHFGDLEALQAALRDLRSFPRVQIGNTFLGKARIATLAKHLLSTGAA